MNPLTGDKLTHINGVPFTIRFTWKALAEVEHKYGDNPNLFDAETVAFVASAGMREKHPDMTAEKIMTLSPPLIPFARDVQEALQWAYFGAESLPAFPDDDVKKNDHLKGGLWKRFVHLFKRG